LKEAAIEFCLSRTNLTGRYYCDPLPENDTYYLLGLRYRVTSDELVGSNLIGWYAVHKSDGMVLNWDINNERPTNLISRCPFEAE
jgi:hypothetical protein